MRQRTALVLAVGWGLVPLLALRAEDEPHKKQEGVAAGTRAGEPLPKVDEKQPAKAAKVEVPYRLTDTKHLMVRVKINGKGPFNLILDTGAPALFITKAVAKKVKAEADEKEWAKFDSFELEGGLKIEKARGARRGSHSVRGHEQLGAGGR